MLKDDQMLVVSGKVLNGETYQRWFYCFSLICCEALGSLPRGGLGRVNLSWDKIYMCENEMAVCV